jgi:signal transduction histidine kinase
VNINDVVNDSIKIFQVELEKNGIDLKVNNDLPIIYCDSKWISHVFTNLINNAIKFIGDQLSPKIRIGYEEKVDFYQFYVEDNGMGVQKEFQERIFDPFQRIYTGKDIEGSGMGLSIVKKILEIHAGKVWVESEKGKGSTFYFTLPKRSKNSKP